MTRLEKVLWEDIVKLLSFNSTNDFIEELALENVYDKDICVLSKNFINPKKLPHYEEDTFDIWNTYLEKVIPTEYLDEVENTFDEDKACDIEDYFFYMQKRMMYANVFNFWWNIFDDFLSKNENEIILNEEINSIVLSYMNYCEEISNSINEYKIKDDWDLYINSLYLPDTEEEEDEIEYNFIKEQINKFSFVDISYDFWSKLNEFDNETLEELKNWVIKNYGEETEPAIPIITEFEEEENE